MNNALMYTIIGLIVIIVAVLIFTHFIFGWPGGSSSPVPTPTPVALIPFRLPL